MKCSTATETLSSKDERSTAGDLLAVTILVHLNQWTSRSGSFCLAQIVTNSYQYHESRNIVNMDEGERKRE